MEGPTGEFPGAAQGAIAGDKSHPSGQVFPPELVLSSLPTIIPPLPGNSATWPHGPTLQGPAVPAVNRRKDRVVAKGNNRVRATHWITHYFKKRNLSIAGEFSRIYDSCDDIEVAYKFLFE